MSGMMGGLFEGIGGAIGGAKAEGYMRENYRLARQNLVEEMARARELWSLYQQLYIPLQTKIVGEAQAPAEEQPGFAKSMGAVSKGYTDASSNMRRLMAGRYPSGSGMEKASQNTLAMNYPKAKSGVWNTYNQERFSKMMQAMGIGTGMPAQSNQMQQGVASTQAGLVNLFAQLANQNYQQSAKGFGQFGDSLMSSGMSGGGGGGMG